MTFKRDVEIQTEAAKALLAMVSNVMSEDDEELRHDAIEGETNFMEAIDATIQRVQAIEGMVAGIDEQAKALRDRKDRLQRQAASLKAACHHAMTTVELRRVELASATLSVRATPAKVLIKEEAEIPSIYLISQAPKLDRRGLLAALKEGELVPGAGLDNGGETLAIRSR